MKKWCNVCDREMHSKNHYHAGDGTTIVEGARGMCGRCYQQVRDAEKATAAIAAGLPKCSGCDQRMRPQRSRAQDYPGIVAEHAKGMCQQCYRKDRESEPVRQRTPEHSLEYLNAELSEFLHLRRERIARERRRQLVAR